MPRKTLSDNIVAQVKRDRLNQHLQEVEDLINRWADELTAPEPFYWLESKSEEANTRVVGPRAPSVTEINREPWKLWACHIVYVPPLEREIDTNHILRRHLRSRKLWQYHSEWQRLLDRITQLADPSCEKIRNVLEPKKENVSDKVIGPVLQAAFQLALRHEIAEGESENKFTEKQKAIISDVGTSKEMSAVVMEWLQVLALEEKMKDLIKKAVKSSDILYPCQFCRKLWQD